MRKNRWVVSFTLLCVGLGGCAADPEPPESTAEETTTPPPAGARTLPIPEVGDETGTGGTETRHGPLVWTLPPGWTEVAPSNTMRRAQYVVPGSAGDGECVVFYFGPGQGGDPMANAERWAGQFTQPDGGNSLDRMTMQEIDGAPLDLRLVEVTGTYTGGMSTGVAPAEPLPNWMLLGGIASGPDAPWFFKLTGPQATLEENRDAFVSMLRSIRQEI